MEGIDTAAELQDQYLTLLVTQLQNQDPLNPTKQEDFIGQLAQFATVEGIEELNTQFSDFLAQSTESSTVQWQAATVASALLGKTVEYRLPASDEIQLGTIDAIELKDGQPLARISGAELVPLEDIHAILND